MLRIVTDGASRRERRWAPCENGVGDMWSNYEVGIGQNRRYLDALAAAPLKDKASPPSTPCAGPEPAKADPCPPQPAQPRRHLPLRAVLAGQHTLSGFRNHHLTEQLYQRRARTTAEAYRRCERTSRPIAKLRGHGLVAKVPRSRLYRVTPMVNGSWPALAIHDDQYARKLPGGGITIPSVVSHANSEPYC